LGWFDDRSTTRLIWVAGRQVLLAERRDLRGGAARDQRQATNSAGSWL
jgi:hypothetical protein